MKKQGGVVKGIYFSSAYIYPNLFFAVTRGSQSEKIHYDYYIIVICKKYTFRSFVCIVGVFILTRKRCAVKHYFIKKSLLSLVKCSAAPI